MGWHEEEPFREKVGEAEINDAGITKPARSAANSLASARRRRRRRQSQTSSQQITEVAVVGGGGGAGKKKKNRRKEGRKQGGFSFRTAFTRARCHKRMTRQSYYAKNIAMSKMFCCNKIIFTCFSAPIYRFTILPHWAIFPSTKLARLKNLALAPIISQHDNSSSPTKTKTPDFSFSVFFFFFPVDPLPSIFIVVVVGNCYRNRAALFSPNSIVLLCQLEFLFFFFFCKRRFPPLRHYQVFPNFRQWRQLERNYVVVLAPWQCQLLFLFVNRQLQCSKFSRLKPELSL